VPDTPVCSECGQQLHPYSREEWVCANEGCQLHGIAFPIPDTCPEAEVEIDDDEEDL
jgi:hypothetical protein